MRLSEAGLAFIKSWESLKLHAYDDATERAVAEGGEVLGTLTIGYGHTGEAGPPNVTPGMAITLEQAERFLFNDLVPIEIEIGHLVKPTLTQPQFDALVSFQFNTGWLEHPHCSLLTALNSGNFALADRDFMLYNRSNGRVMKGLTRRRRAEMQMFASGIYAGA